MKSHRYEKNCVTEEANVDGLTYEIMSVRHPEDREYVGTKHQLTKIVLLETSYEGKPEARLVFEDVPFYVKLEEVVCRG